MATSSTMVATDRGRFVIGLLPRLLILAALVFVCTVKPQPASASTVLNAAAANAVGGLGICGSKQGKELYNCVADVLDQMSSNLTRISVPETQEALRTAATGLRAATTKAQAISAISRCQSAIAGALKKVRAIGGAMLVGWGDSGLSSISSVLARAIQLIQSKG